MKNRFIKNLGYLILISTLLIGGVILLRNHKFQAQRTYNYNLIYTTLVTIACFGGIGVLLGLSNTNFSLKEIEVPRFDRIRLLSLGLPSLLTSLSYIWVYLGLFNKYPIIYSYIQEIDYLVMISSIILGHTLVSSIYTD